MLYQISDSCLWDVDAARFVDQAPEGAEIIPLYADGKPATEDYLRRTLEFYGYSVGPELLTLEGAQTKDDVAAILPVYTLPEVQA